jgi:hypothetical protein
MLDQGCGLEASPRWVRRRFLAETGTTSNLKVNTGTITKRCIFVDAIASSAGHKYFVNTELTKIKITVIIYLKWHNLDYPCYPVGRKHVTFPVNTKHNIL